MISFPEFTESYHLQTPTAPNECSLDLDILPHLGGSFPVLLNIYDFSLSISIIRILRPKLSNLDTLTIS